MSKHLKKGFFVSIPTLAISIRCQNILKRVWGVNSHISYIYQLRTLRKSVVSFTFWDNIIFLRLEILSIFPNKEDFPTGKYGITLSDQYLEILSIFQNSRKEVPEKYGITLCDQYLRGRHIVWKSLSVRLRRRQSLERVPTLIAHFVSVLNGNTQILSEF